MFNLQSYFKVFTILFFLTFFIKDYLFAQNIVPKRVKATYYSSKFTGKKTYSGERYDPKKYTAAHKSLLLNSLIKVTNPTNMKVVVVRINDRFKKENYIDLSWIAAKEIDIIKTGTTHVLIEPADSLTNNDYIKLYFTQE